MNAQPFLVRVGAAGLPHRFLTLPWRGDENLQSLLPQDIATFYWLLKTIHFRYRYHIQEQIFDRYFSASCFDEPLQRLRTPPEFRHQLTDETLSLRTELEFLPGEVSQSNGENYGLKMNFGEIFSPHRDFSLFSFQNDQNLTLDIYWADFFGIAIPFYLSTRFPAGTLSGSIDSIAISGDFWQISSNQIIAQNSM